MIAMRKPSQRLKSRLPVASLILLAMIFASLSPLFTATSIDSTLESEETNSYADHIPMSLYTIYVDKHNSTVGGDGYLTTKVPSSDQRNESVLDNNLEFRSRDFLTEFTLRGRQTTNANEWKVPLYVFLRATSSSQDQTATFTFTLRIDGQTLSTEQKQIGACSSIFTGCGWNHEIVNLKWLGARDQIIPAGGSITLEVSAESTCEGSGGPFSSCDAEVMWGDPDSSDDFTKMEFWSNAVAGSAVKIHRPGALWTDPEVVDWYPNDMPENREMTFTVDVRNAFGREDITQVNLQMRNPSGSYVVQHTFSNSELTLDEGGLVGEYSWVYPAGIEGGAYELSLSVSDVQNHQFLVSHEDVLVHESGLGIRSANDRTVEYVAPDQTTVIAMVLRHVGAFGNSLDVKLCLQTSLPSSWLRTFDRPHEQTDCGDYDLSDGGQEIQAQLTLEAPSELTNVPDRLDISARAYNESGSEVQYTVYQVYLEKLDVYAPPMVSMWDTDHELQISNSSRQESFDPTIPRFVDSGVFTPFYIELFNTGFDQDSFRIDVTEKPRGTVFYFVDNDTSEQIDQNLDDGLWHTAILDRHDTQTIALYIKPSPDEEDPDSGLMRIEVFSAGDSALSSAVEFTPHRTYGVQARVVFDCDGAGNGLGHVEHDNCLDDDGDGQIDLRMRIEATQTSGSENELVEWRIVNPADLQRNMDANPRYGLWDYNLSEDEAGETPVPMIEMATGDSVEFWLEAHLTSQVLADNHTIFLRIEEANDSAERFFDLPISIEVGEGTPALEIRQVSQNQVVVPGTTAVYTMLLKNDGNTDMQVLLDTTHPHDWTVTAENPETGSSVVLVPAFDEITFNLEVTAADSARHGDIHSVIIRGSPQSFDHAYESTYDAIGEVNVRVEIDDPALRIRNEIVNMRTETQILLAGGLLLLVAAVAAGKRRRDYMWDEDDEEEEFDEPEEEEFDLPGAVTTESDVDTDEIELLDDDIDDDEIELLDD